MKSALAPLTRTYSARIYLLRFMRFYNAAGELKIYVSMVHCGGFIGLFGA
ncbi:hypothetical protein [uncultured Helicobacter sp.]